MDGNEPRKGATETRKKKWLYELLDDMKRYKVGRKQKKITSRKKIWRKGKWNSLMARNITEGGKGEADNSKSKSG